MPPLLKDQHATSGASTPRYSGRLAFPQPRLIFTPMFPHAKYIVGIPRSSLHPITQAIVIPTTMHHVDVRGVFVDGSITSAGFFNYDESRVYVSGNSTTLNKTSLPADEALVAMAIAHPCY